MRRSQSPLARTSFPSGLWAEQAKQCRDVEHGACDVALSSGWRGEQISVSGIRQGGRRGSVCTSTRCPAWSRKPWRSPGKLPGAKGDPKSARKGVIRTIRGLWPCDNSIRAPDSPRAGCSSDHLPPSGPGLLINRGAHLASPKQPGRDPGASAASGQHNPARVTRASTTAAGFRLLHLQALPLGP